MMQSQTAHHQMAAVGLLLHRKRILVSLFQQPCSVTQTTQELLSQSDRQKVEWKTFLQVAKPLPLTMASS
jgi:hypothetical protein